MLTRLARTWSGEVPATAVLSRHSGGEFTLTAEGTSAAQLADLCHHLTLLAAPVTISAGVAELGPEEDWGSVMRRVDTALYRAKATGRARICIAEPSDGQLSAELAAAIATGVITVALQPIVRPATEELMGVKALARWHPPQRGLVSPSVFIPVAERTAQVNALGRSVLEQACQDATHLCEGLGRTILLTVNVSGQQLIRPDYCDELADVLSATAWPAAQLVLEVTESTVDFASAQALSSLAQVRDLGVAIAIDDFGTGYSAFSQLDAPPADYLKLDAAFTADITTSSRRAATLATLLELCTQLGITVVAEGVKD